MGGFGRGGGFPLWVRSFGRITERNGGGGGFEWRMMFSITSGAAVVAEF